MWALEGGMDLDGVKNVGSHGRIKVFSKVAESQESLHSVFLANSPLPCLMRVQ